MWKKIRNKKLALGLALLAASMAFGPTMTNAASADTSIQSERPAPPDWDGNGQPPAPPTDENGNPLPPPDHDGGNSNGGRPTPPDGNGNGQPPAPPTDENGNPLPPPDHNGGNDNGDRPAPPDGNGSGRPPAPPTDENGNPLPPPDHNGGNGNNNRPAPPDGNGQPPQGGISGRGQDAKSADNLSASHISDKKNEALESQSLTASKENESAVLARNNASLTLRGMHMTKTGDTSSEEESNFTGQNAVVLSNNSTVAISDSTLTSAADGANAVFSTGRKSKITLQRVTIRTEGNSSRGLDATYGGTVTGDAVDIATKGAHCAALATDRGEGNVSVTNSRLVTEGEGSPCIYSTGAISAADTMGEAYGSEIAVVEGKNSITLDRANLTGHDRNGVMLYQSFSGDADVGVARFSAKDSKLTNLSAGAMFFVTNTKAEIALENTTLNSPADSPLLSVGAARWGRTGANGGNVTLTTARQTLTGDIKADSLSTVTMNLGENSQWTGACNSENTAGSIAVNLKNSASWTLTGDSYVSSFTDETQDFSNINSNGFSIYYDSEKSPSLSGAVHDLPGGGQLAPKD